MSAEPPHDALSWVPASIGAATTVVAGILMFLGQRLVGQAAKLTASAEVQKAGAAEQTAINTGFNDLLQQMRQELKVACHQRDEFKELLAAEKAGREADRMKFAGEIAQLRAVSEGMERLLRRHGITMPERKVYPDPEGEPTHEPPKIVETTLRQDAVDGED